MRFLRLLAAAFVLCVLTSTRAVAQDAPPPETAPQAEAPTVPLGSLYLPDADLMEVIDTLAQQLQMNYVVDADIVGTVTLNTYGEAGALDARNLLELLLRINGYGLVQEGELYRIVTIDRMRRAALNQVTRSSDIPADDQMMLNLVFLKYVTADELIKVLNEFTDDRTIIRSYAPANLLLILDSRRNMRRIMDLVDLFDSDVFAGERVRLYDIENTLPSQLVNELQQVLQSLSLDNQTSTVRFLPIDRISTMIAIAPNPGVFETVEEWIRRLDVPITITSSVIDTYVYRVRYGRADCLSLALNQLYYPGYGSGMGGFGGGGFGGQAGGFGVGGFGGQAGGFGGGGFGGQGGGGTSSGFNGNFGGSGGCGPYSGLGGGGVGGGFGGGAFGGGYQYGYPTFGGYAAQAYPGQVPGQIPVPGGLVGTAATSSGTDPNAAAVAGGGTAEQPPPPPRIVANPLDNSLLIQGSAQQYQSVLKLLQELDRPPRQILLEAKIYQVILNKSFASGVEARFREVTGANRTAVGSLIDGAVNLSAGALVGQSRELLAFMTLQETTGNVNVISEPSLIATDSIPATITVGTQVPVLTGQIASPSTTLDGTITQGISSRSTGVTLQVNARVNPSGIVTLIVNHEVSSPSGGEANSLTPSFDQQIVQTQITLQDGDTVAIGGIISESTTNNSTGIPGLHRIPVLGNLFGTDSLSSERSELIIFMTPHVIYDTTDLVEVSEELKQRMKKLRRLIDQQ